jgi:hypothetical protein
VIDAVDSTVRINGSADASGKINAKINNALLISRSPYKKILLLLHIFHARRTNYDIGDFILTLNMAIRSNCPHGSAA